MVTAHGNIVATLDIKVLEFRYKGAFKTRPEMLIRDSDGGEYWVAAGDTLTLHVKLTIS